MKKHFSVTIVIVCFALILAGCSILNPIPEEYTEGLRVPREYPDDDLEIYDDAIVFETDDDDEEIYLAYGTEDDIDDVIDHYEDLFDDNNLIVEEKEDDRDEFYAKGRGDGFLFEIEAEEAKGGIEEKLFKTVVKISIEFVEKPVIDIGVTGTPTNTQAPTPTAAGTGDDYDPNWDKDYEPFYVDVSTLTNEDLIQYIVDRVWYYIAYADGYSINLDTGSLIECIYNSDGTFQVLAEGEEITGTWIVSENVLYCNYANGNTDSWVIAYEFGISSDQLLFYEDVNLGSYWLYTSNVPGAIMTYNTDAEMAAAIANRTFEAWYFLYPDGSLESAAPAYITVYGNGEFEEVFQGYTVTGTWQIVDEYFEFGYHDSDSSWMPIIINYDTTYDMLYLAFADQRPGYEGCYWVYVAR